MRVPDDKLRLFISHKHDDHKLAKAIKESLGALPTEPEIECFVSGVDIAAGTDWNRTIKQELARSHLLLLLFTNPSLDWDWCLYEAGLFTRFSNDDVQAVVALSDKSPQALRPISNLQGLVATKEEVAKFIGRLCREPWKTTDDWRRGAIASGDIEDDIEVAAAKIAEEFDKAVSSGGTPRDEAYYPCHRVLLDLTQVEKPASKGIPLDARVVVEGSRATSSYTLSVFGATREGKPTWGELVDLVDGSEADWRRELDAAFELAKQKVLFAPITAGFCANDPTDKDRRLYVPQLYRILQSDDRVVGVTIVMDRRAGRE